MISFAQSDEHRQVYSTKENHCRWWVCQKQYLAHPNDQYVLQAVQVNSYTHIGCLIDDLPVLLDFEINDAQEDNGINALQGPRHNGRAGPH